ncbi:maleylpyruvate isomerase family mycothiol-dependent enzyme [Streptomyces sp. AK02-01A]|uniref:maleylpyruvate isomerase family mycothiol-dependent enzyme n=1 Tax=Streptomyces sp. AK02-01A TaxID=3028648 RepID=UPI0029B358EC|nr:maleylpyruvate isomerase family mycothiol-dependent enzyme [Streptomyces sp. AK02-01A]MDX3851572.1 maleylpyruvate isomerase family mycothiol-dependent enzyme [Streptomyces sp. AK02-01A]
MIDHVHDLASVREATERLLSEAALLDNAGLAAPSRLPGWSRGHVLAHIARNADALANVLEGRPMYESAEAREADIERDASRSLAVQLTDVRNTAARFQHSSALPADWTRVVTMRNGVTDMAARVPFRRWAEVELHHVDLGLGRDLEDLSDEFTDREIGFLAERFSGNPAVPPLALSASDGRIWRTGRTEGTALSVSGPAPDLMGWLAGRRDGAALKAPDGQLPVLPPL